MISFSHHPMVLFGVAPPIKRLPRYLPQCGIRPTGLCASGGCQWIGEERRWSSQWRVRLVSDVITALKQIGSSAREAR